MITDYICIKDGQVVEVDVSVEVTLSRINKKFEQEIKVNIDSKINDFFSLKNWDYGQNLRESDMIKALAAVKQAESFDIVFTTNSGSGNMVDAKFYEIIRPGLVEVAFMYQ
ncbi:hypothetical protein EBT16_13770 [bacterium]|nr:hypothetical protein [bacterium]